jgi:hypothetical protein
VLGQRALESGGLVPPTELRSQWGPGSRAEEAVSGGQSKNLDVVSGLTLLEELTLRSITLPDLSLLLPLPRLLSLELKLGGAKDLSLLPRIGQLRYLELWLVKGLSDLSGHLETRVGHEPWESP